MTVSADEGRSDPPSGVAVRLPSVAELSPSGTLGNPVPRNPSFLPLLVLTLLLLLAAVLRIVATHNDLWLDELISLRAAQALTAPWQVFTAVHNDNNHYVNTLYLYFLRDQDAAPPFRYFSVLCGVLLVAAGYWLLAQRSRVEGLILAGLLACSYPLIHISSEARGYSAALLGSMLACAALSRWIADEKKPSFFLGFLYGIATVLALLSHLTSCMIWIPMAAASLIVVVGRRHRLKWFSLWIALNLLPLGALAALYFLDLRFVVPLGATPMSVLHGLSRLLALGTGWPAKDAATVWIMMLPLIGLIVWQLAADQKSGSPLPILLAPIYLVPLVGVLLVRPLFFSPRYFLVILPFIYVYIAILLARLAQNRRGRIALTALLALFLTGQMFLYSRFLQVGRGQFIAALEYITAHTTSPEISVASNQDFRSALELGYFAPRVLGNRRLLVYVTRDDRTFFQPEWYILHEEGSDPPGPAFLKQSGRPAWQRVAYFGASELSGQAWTIYHRATD